MTALTRNNIAYNLELSPFKLTVAYENGEDITYVFSSARYVEKFKERTEGNRELINKSLSNRFGFAVENNTLADLKLYTAIEKRGFLLYKGLVKVECLNNLILNGSRMNIKN